MRAASIGLAVLLPLVVGVSVGSSDDYTVKESGFFHTQVPYDVATPAPEGRVTCTVLITAQKEPSTSANFWIGVAAHKYEDESEITIPELGIASGYQAGCDLWPSGPWVRKRELEFSGSVFQFEHTVEIHDHPQSFCDRAGRARGIVDLMLEPTLMARGVVVMGSIFCEVGPPRE